MKSSKYRTDFFYCLLQGGYVTAVCLSMPKIFEEMMIMGHGTDLFGDVLEFGGNFDL